MATWWIIEGVIKRGGDVAMAQHGCRITDFTRGESLGNRDHIVEGGPPRPKSMSPEQYASYPERMLMREVEVDGRILVSILLAPNIASAQEIDRLYAMRWNIEVDFRVIKATLQMDVLRCKLKEMIEKEIAVYLLAYNLVRLNNGNGSITEPILIFICRGHIMLPEGDMNDRHPQEGASAQSPGPVFRRAA